MGKGVLELLRGGGGGKSPKIGAMQWLRGGGDGCKAEWGSWSCWEATEEGVARSDRGKESPKVGGGKEGESPEVGVARGGEIALREFYFSMQVLSSLELKAFGYL